MEAIKKFQQTIEMEIKDFISQTYLNVDEKVYKLTKPKTTKIGKIFEIIFRTLIENEGLIEGKDFLDLRDLRHRCVGIPDFFFVKSNTFIEIKSNCSNDDVCYSKGQLEKIKFLKEKGFEIKTIFFNVKILEDNISFYSLLKDLVGIK